MKSLIFALLLWGSLLALVAGFSSDDYEIFRLKDEIERAEGSDVTFYEFLGVPPSASQDDINKASRKKSRLIHPDKAKAAFIAAHNTQKHKPILGDKTKPRVHVNKPPTESEIQKVVKIANDRYARLGVITEVLKGPGRERYDHFLSNGFPAWRGTGYYYARFRPGLGSVLIGLFIVGGGAAHYGAMYVSWKRQREFVDRYIKHARKSAWGDDSAIRGIPGVEGAVLGTSAPSPGPPTPAQENGAAVLNRRQRRMQAVDAKKDAKKGKGKGSGTSTPMEEIPEPSAGPQGAKKRVYAENGKALIVDSVGNVYLEGENEEGVKGEYLLDVESIPKPRFEDTVLFRLPIYLYELGRERVLGKRLTGQRLGEVEAEEEEDSDGEEEEEMEQAPKKRSAQLAEQRKKGASKKNSK